MSKIKTTRNYLNNLYGRENIYSVGYCDLQYLLYSQDPTYYNYGIYGWNYDAYTFSNCIITTGYRPIGLSLYDIADKHNVKLSDYDKKAHDILVNGNGSYSETRDKINEVLRDLFNKLDIKARVY